MLLSHPYILLMSMPGGTEWIFILLAIVLLFGAKKIPDLAKGIGKGMREFKDAKEGKEDTADEAGKQAL